jgi:hypothetical protein
MVTQTPLNLLIVNFLACSLCRMDPEAVLKCLVHLRFEVALAEGRLDGSESSEIHIDVHETCKFLIVPCQSLDYFNLKHPMFNTSPGVFDLFIT